MTGPAMMNIFAPVPSTRPSVLNSMAALTTALAKPVMGTRVPAPAFAASFRRFLRYRHRPQSPSGWPRAAQVRCSQPRPPSFRPARAPDSRSGAPARSRRSARRPRRRSADFSPFSTGAPARPHSGRIPRLSCASLRVFYASIPHGGRSIQKFRMECGSSRICHCEEAQPTWQSREGTVSSYRER